MKIITTSQRLFLREFEKYGLHFVKEFMYNNNPTYLYCIKYSSKV